MSRVLVADDEPAIRKVVRDALEREGHEVVTAVDGGEALERFDEGSFDLVVTDLAMPRVDGLELVKEVRRRSPLPILVLTVRNEEREKVRLLDEGADDYVTKPFGVAELVARARALLRRGESARGPALARFGDVEVDADDRIVKKAGRPVHLTPIEFSILATMLKKPGAVWTHRQLMAEVWGTTAGVTSDTLRVHVGGLRRKLEDDPNRPRWFRTEPWVGYRFSPECPAARTAEGHPDGVSRRDPFPSCMKARDGSLAPLGMTTWARRLPKLFRPSSGLLFPAGGMLAFMNDKRKAIRCGALALAVLFGGCLVALFAPRFQAGIAAASFVGYVACTRRAMVLCGADDAVFEPKTSDPLDAAAREAVRTGLLAGSAGALSLGRSVSGGARLARSGSTRRGRPAFPRALEGTR